MKEIHIENRLPAVGTVASVSVKGAELFFPFGEFQVTPRWNEEGDEITFVEKSDLGKQEIVTLKKIPVGIPTGRNGQEYDLSVKGKINERYRVVAIE